MQGMGQKLVWRFREHAPLRRKDDLVILLDARMPGIDGFETAKLIRERQRSRHTPIIFVTGAYEDLGSMFRGYEVGAVDYIVKPLNPEVLKSKISVFIELYAKNAALIREVAERLLTEERLRESEEKLRALAARLQSVREEDQIRIARDIHGWARLDGLKNGCGLAAGKLPAEQTP